MRKTISLLALLAGSIAACAQSDSHPEILVLGTYHMANPGRDIFNMQADDVLSSKRQQEIAQAVEALKKFRPTKIAVEAEVGSTTITQHYTDYLAGKYKPYAKRSGGTWLSSGKGTGTQDNLSR